MNLHKIAPWTNEIASANGFDKPTWDNILAKLALAVSELDEARDGVVNWDMEGQDPLAEELADTAIRLLSILDSVWPETWADRVTNPRYRGMQRPNGTIETILWKPLGYICKAMETWRHNNAPDTCINIEFALLELWRIADMFQIDLTAEIIAKCHKNAKRPKLHGKKQSAG